MRLLLAADLHIGTASSRVAEQVEPSRLRTADAWFRLVDFAVERSVDVVCLAGDVVDEANQFWEAIGPLERGVERLREHGVRVVAVAGNHDYDVLGRLADELPEEHFTLLGRGGAWKRLPLSDADGRVALHVDGWSFPDRYVTYDPVEAYPEPPRDGVPVLGMIHGDVESDASPYAPLDPAALGRKPVSGWLLGHIHQGRNGGENGFPFLLYPGSPQAMDPSETGAHGVWLTEASSGGLAPPQFFPLSTVRYERIALDLGEVSTPAALEATTRARLRERAETLAVEAGGALACLSLRVRLEGRTPVFDRLGELTHALSEQLDERVGDVAMSVERVENAAEPALDVEQWAEDDSPLGLTAKLLLDLDREEPAEETRQLIRTAQRRIREVRGESYYNDLGGEADEAVARQYLKEQARALLGELQKQTSA